MSDKVVICQECNIHLYDKDIEKNKCVACGLEVTV